MSRLRLSSSVSSITINSIPQWNQDLYVSILARTDRASSSKSTLGIRFNSDSGSKYSHSLWNVQDGQAGNLSGAQLNWYNPLNSNAGTSIYCSAVPGNTGASNTFGYSHINIPNYSSSNKFKSMYLNSVSQQGNWVSHGYEGAGQWNDISPINSINIFDINGANLVSGSLITVYGMG
jgi:hypothetical protein